MLSDQTKLKRLPGFSGDIQEKLPVAAGPALKLLPAVVFDHFHEINNLSDLFTHKG